MDGGGGGGGGGGGNDMTSPSSGASPATSVTKRKGDEGQTQTRAKRARYISIACNQCKRRKIKCNGQTPCQRCGNLGLECLYAPNCCNNFRDSDEFKQMLTHVTTLQHQVDTLYSNLSSLKNQVDTKVETPSQPTPQLPYSRSLPPPIVNGSPYSSTSNTLKPILPRFHGPTSPAFGFNVAQSSLRTLGINPTEELNDEQNALDGSPGMSPTLPPVNVPSQDSLHATKDPLWSINREEARRLLHIYEEEMGCMYPVTSLEKMEKHLDFLYNFMDAAMRSGFIQGGQPGADTINDDQTKILKLMLASALIAEGSGNSEMGRRLFDSVRPSLEQLMLAPPSIVQITQLAIAAIFYFHADEEATSWRLAGMAARLNMELGLHRNETYRTMFNDEEEREAATLLFWAIRILDQRWSFGTGMPFAIRDADIDPNLRTPGPVTPYLAALVKYTQIATHVWERLTGLDASRVKLPYEEIQYLDYETTEWYRAIPEYLQYSSQHQPDLSSLRGRIDNRLRIILYLRVNQMRLHIHRPVMHSAARIVEHQAYAHTAVGLAKDTIRALSTLDRTTDIYRRQQVMFNYFLVTALATLFLGVCHAPDQFSNRCRDEFYMALDLVRSMTPQSFVAKRLWKTIRGLKEIGPKLGLNTPGGGPEAAAGAHNARHSLDEIALYGNGHANIAIRDTPNGMADDLTSLFEAVGGYGNVGMPAVMPNGYPAPHVPHPGEPDSGNGVGMSHVYGLQDDVSRILRDLF